MEESLTQRFYNFLLEYSRQSDPAQRKQIEDALWREFGTELTVFVLDMSGFSLLTQKYGIVHYLSMVRRMQLTAQPIIESHGGRVVKFEADNCFAVFPAPLAAVQTAIALQFAFDAANLITPPELDIRVSCGIDCGRILAVGDNDCFGNAVNRASKLGEDLAEAREILVSQEAFALIPPEAGLRGRALELSISGLALQAVAVEYQAQ